VQSPQQIETTDVRAYESLYTVLVNDEPLSTPKGHPVSLGSWELANAIADDLAEEGTLDLQQVTLYALYATQRDFIEDRIDATIAALLEHLPGDFVLSPDADPVLGAKQLAAWAPLLQFWRDFGPEVPIAKPMHPARIPWELTEALSLQLLAMNPAQLSVVLNAMMNLGSVSLGILLARQAMTLDQAVAALTVTSIASGGAAEEQERFVGETRQLVRRLLRYARMSQ
jgi:chaperone required for assembly of F1-ATPase